MSYTLNALPGYVGKRKKIIGRGFGSGKGAHTVGRGMKGQKSRAGSRIGPFFEGGQNPLSMRIPHKKGFTGHVKETIEIVRLDQLNVFKDGDTVDASELFKVGLIQGKGIPKVLGGGDLERKLTLDGIRCSKSAREILEKKGGSVI